MVSKAASLKFPMHLVRIGLSKGRGEVIFQDYGFPTLVIAGAGLAKVKTDRLSDKPQNLVGIIMIDLFLTN